MANEEWYSNLLHERARLWGCAVSAELPSIDDATAPYPKLTVLEVLTWRVAAPRQHTEIKLVTLNGRYSYTLNFQWRTHGRGYNPCLKFCDPYPTKSDALAAALVALQREDPPREMRTWIHDLTTPPQLSLFSGASNG